MNESEKKGYWDALAMREDPVSKKTYWARIGRAFVNTDGSYNILLDAVPIGGKMQIRPHMERPAQGELPLRKNGAEPWSAHQ